MKPGSVIAVGVLTFITYIVYSGSISLYDLVTGFIVALITSIFFSKIIIDRPVKILSPRRWLYLVVYVIKYFTIYETQAHLDVIKRILHPKTPVNPAVVKIPFYVNTDYAITAVANSITNTPGTVVVEVDEVNKVFYVHWINAKTLDPREAREEISSVFEKYSENIFD